MDKRLMKLAGLLKEDVNPYEDVPGLTEQEIEVLRQDVFEKCLASVLSDANQAIRNAIRKGEEPTGVEGYIENAKQDLAYNFELFRDYDSKRNPSNEAWQKYFEVEEVAREDGELYDELFHITDNIEQGAWSELDEFLEERIKNNDWKKYPVADYPYVEYVIKQQAKLRRDASRKKAAQKWNPEDPSTMPASVADLYHRIQKEDINPYEDNNVEEEVAKYIKEKVEDEIANAAAQIDKLGKGTYCIYDVASSRGHQDATVVGRDLSKQEALNAIKETLQERWVITEEWAEDDEDVDETNAESMIDFLERAGEFIGGGEGVQDYSGYPALEIGLAEESYLGIVHSKDKEEAEEDYGVYEDEMGDI